MRAQGVNESDDETEICNLVDTKMWVGGGGGSKFHKALGELPMPQVGSQPLGHSLVHLSSPYEVATPVADHTFSTTQPPPHALDVDEE